MTQIPAILEDYLNYMETIKGISPSTIKEYYFDLRMFLRFLKLRYKIVDSNINFEEIDISDINIDFIKRPPYFHISPSHKAKTWLLDPQAPKVEAPEGIKRLNKYFGGNLNE